jgi:tRNA (cytidine/uridine-2'-O-)-methyltransferase
MFDIILFEPEIPPNTGNVIRLCANTGCRLHLIQPLGFSLSDAQVKRAGLDYHDMARVSEYPSLAHCLERLQPRRLYAIETGSPTCYSTQRFEPNDALLFGRETTGLPLELIHSTKAHHISIPMLSGNRSINLSNSVALVVFEAWRQNGFTLP